MTNFTSKTLLQHAVVPLVPVDNAILMPNSTLVLTMSAVEAESMIDSMSGLGFPGESIGLVYGVRVQENGEGAKTTSFYRTGSLATIYSMKPLNEHEVELVLIGVSRFDVNVIKDLPTAEGGGHLRVGEVSYDRFASDQDNVGKIKQKISLLDSAQMVFQNRGVDRSSSDFKGVPDKTIIGTLVQDLPLPVNEKQAILEEPEFQAQVKLLKTFIQHQLYADFYNHTPTMVLQ